MVSLCMPGKAGRPLKWPIVTFPADYGRRERTRVCLRQMKKAGATDLAIACMKNDLDRLAEQVRHNVDRMNEAKRRK